MPKTIEVRSTDGHTCLVFVSHIVCIEAVGNASRIHLTNGKYVSVGEGHAHVLSRIEMAALGEDGR
jgi:uncharacterized protein YlzI (FlbEa/FlbD family)